MSYKDDLDAIAGGLKDTNKLTLNAITELDNAGKLGMYGGEGESGEYFDLILAIDYANATGETIYGDYNAFKEKCLTEGETVKYVATLPMNPPPGTAEQIGSLEFWLEYYNSIIDFFAFGVRNGNTNQAILIYWLPDGTWSLTEPENPTPIK